VRRVLDCSCGIGTQAIGLALAGHRITGSDVSEIELARAAREARSFGVEIATAVADMRTLAQAFGREFDAVVTCDNAIAHFPPVELPSVFRSVRSVLEDGGVVLASVRDYGALRAERPTFVSPATSLESGARRVAFQLWEWDEDGESYVLEQFFVRQVGDRFETRCARTRLYAHTRDTTCGAAAEGGLTSIRWLPPSESGYYQPLVVGRR
jgi:SAM-dependent methyltransferase